MTVKKNNNNLPIWKAGSNKWFFLSLCAYLSQNVVTKGLKYFFGKTEATCRFTRCRAKFGLKILTGHVVHTEVCNIFVLFTPNLLTDCISSLLSGFTICPCAERHSTEIWSRQTFHLDGWYSIYRTPAHRRLLVWKASHVISICKITFLAFQC